MQDGVTTKSNLVTINSKKIEVIPLNTGIETKGYSVSFNFEKGSYVEVISRRGLNLPAVFDLGQVAFGLAACKDEAASFKFLQKYKCSVVYDDGDPVLVEEDSPWFTYLCFDQAAIREFIEIVLLKPAPVWAEGVPSSRRLPVFHYLHNTDKVTDYLQDVALKPVVNTRAEAWRGLNLIKGTTSPNLQEDLKTWGKAWAEKDKKPEQLYNEITRRRTAGLEYETDSLISIAWLELYSMAERDIVVRQCKRCGGYFVPKVKKVYFCDNCAKTYSRQALYDAVKWEGMPEEEKAKAREKNAQTKATSRLVKKLHEEGKSIREISKETGRAVDRVRRTLKKVRQQC